MYTPTRVYIRRVTPRYFIATFVQFAETLGRRNEESANSCLEKEGLQATLVLACPEEEHKVLRMHFVRNCVALNIFFCLIKYKDCISVLQILMRFDNVQINWIFLLFYLILHNCNY